MTTFRAGRAMSEHIPGPASIRPERRVVPPLRKPDPPSALPATANSWTSPACNADMHMRDMACSRVPTAGTEVCEWPTSSCQ